MLTQKIHKNKVTVTIYLLNGKINASKKNIRVSEVMLDTRFLNSKLKCLKMFIQNIHKNEVSV